MATDTARVQLELASGRNEVTAPFLQTAQRRRKQHEPDAVSVDAPGVERPAAAQVLVDIPLAAAAAPDTALAAEPGVTDERPLVTTRIPWIAFAVALVAVAVAVWWVMSQRMPDIDPREVIERNLHDAQTAMADGRYTDPPERSALHYYSTALSLDPDNADALAGIDAIADRHLTNARVLLADRKIAEAGVALEKARRVRPDHDGLAPLDQQWRAELRKLLAVTSVVAKAPEMPLKPIVAKVRDTDAPRAAQAVMPAVEKVERAGAAPDVGSRTVPSPLPAEVPATAASLAASQPSTQLRAMAAPVADDVRTSTPGTGSSIVEDNVVPVRETAAIPAARSIDPKLVKMVPPEYPQEALMRGIEGWVDVSLQISPAGDVIAPRVEETSRGRLFNRAALAAVQQWKYESRADGTTSERVRVRVQFQRSN